MANLNRRSVLSGASIFAGLTLAGCDTPAPAVGLQSVVTGFDHPWGVAFLPDGTALVTERKGSLRLVNVGNTKLSDPITGLPEVDANNQGGLLGIALDPEFTSNRLVYLAFAEPHADGNCTAVFRGRLSGDGRTLDDGRTIFRQNVIAASTQHFGARLVFGRDGHLFVTTGDRNLERERAQDPALHVGKVLRITRDGAAAPGNPLLPGWASEVWSIGHRNIQAATLHPETGELWIAEHGARGGDEINVPKPGLNYGWPVISYGREYTGGQIGEGTMKDGMEQPLHYWDPSIAPSGMAFCTGDKYPAWRGNLFVGALVGQHVARLEIGGGKVTREAQLFKNTARFRDVVQGPDGFLYVLTDEAAPQCGLFRIASQ